MSHACFVTKRKNMQPIFWYHMKSNHYFWDNDRGWWAMSPSTWNLHLKWPNPFDKGWLRQISAYNVWTVRASEKCPIIANRKLTTCFPTSYRTGEVRMLPLTQSKGSSKAHLSFWWIKLKFNRGRLLPISAYNVWTVRVFVCENFQRQSCNI